MTELKSIETIKSIFTDKEKKQPTTYNSQQINRKSVVGSSKNLNVTEREDPINKEINNICISSYEINRVLRKLDYIVSEKEKHRNYKLISDFNRERYNLENEQLKIRSQIENISHINSNEKFINQIKDEKNKQQELFNKYYKMNTEAITKINKPKDIKPILEEKINKKTTKLKAINHNNLQLMNELQELKLKKIQEYKDSLVVKKQSLDHVSITNKSNLINESINHLSKSKNKYSEYGKDNKDLNKSILNITEIVDENANLKDIYSQLKNKKRNLIGITKENKILSNELSAINNQIFLLSRVFSEGMYQIGLELRKVQELQLNKIINKNNYGNSLYFELVKDKLPPNVTGSCYPIANDFKLPIIHENITKKYGFQ